MEEGMILLFRTEWKNEKKNYKILNKMKYNLLAFLFIILTGCSTKVTEEDLIDGYWIATAGYQDGKPEGEPYCATSVAYGLEFKDEKTVYVEAYESDFEYWLEDNNSGVEIHLAGDDLGIYLIYDIDKVSENEIGLTSDKNVRPEEESCYLERQ